MKSGLRFSLKSEYRPMTISARNSRKCWEPDFQLSLREVAGDTYPQADYELGGEDPHVVFSKVRFGRELLKRSKDYDQSKPSSTEVARVQGQIEQIHALANDPNVPSDRREFFRDFRLPDPKAMPECWRTMGFFRKRLHILWGMEKVGKNATFLPSSKNSLEWADGKNRKKVEDVLDVHDLTRADWRPWLLNALTFGWYGRRHGYRQRGGCLGSILTWLVRLLLIMLVASLFRGCLPRCSSVPPVSIPPISFPPVLPPSASTPSEDDKGSETPKDGKGEEAPALPEDEDGANSENAESSSPSKSELSKSKDSGLDDKKPESPPLPPQDEVSGRESVEALSFGFRVNPPKELSASDDIAKVEFSVSPIADLQGKDYVISDWCVNGEVRRPGASRTFAPPEGLRYDKSYTISASVTVDGKEHRVEPFQWNMVDSPTWQILEVGRDASGERRQYKIVCCNSSSVEPTVKSWKVAFRPGGKNEGTALAFDHDEKDLGKDGIELDWGIDRYKGAYYLELTAEVEYSLRGKDKTATHVETFPFTHDSSADALTKAKYEVVIPNVYFCLARLTDGSLINGTAFAVSEKRLLSNYHVAVGGIPECYANSGDYKVAGPVTLTNIKGKTYYAKVEWSDRGRDLAVLRLCDKRGNDADDRLPGYLHLANDALVSGICETAARHVFAIGYPKGTVCKGPPAFTDGKAEQVISRDYKWNGDAQTFDTIVNYTSTKCGYSGGPLVDYQTETVLGVNFGGLVEQLDGHKAASLATSVKEVRRAFTKLDAR